jgi:hypothetical protein
VVVPAQGPSPVPIKQAGCSSTQTSEGGAAPLLATWAEGLQDAQSGDMGAPAATEAGGVLFDPPRPRFNGRFRRALHEAGLLVPLVTVVTEPSASEGGDNDGQQVAEQLQGEAGADEVTFSACVKGGSTEMERASCGQGPCAAGEVDSSCKEACMGAVAAACQLLAAVDEPLDPESVGVILKLLEWHCSSALASPASPPAALDPGPQNGSEAGQPAAKAEGQEAARRQLPLATATRCMATLWALAQHAQHRCVIASARGWAVLLECAMEPTLARLERAPSPRLQPAGRRGGVHASGCDNSSCSGCSTGGYGCGCTAVPRLQLGAIDGGTHSHATAASAGSAGNEETPGSGRSAHTGDAALQAAILGVRAAWLLLQGAVVQRSVSLGLPPAADTLYQGSPSGWWGMQLPQGRALSAAAGAAVAARQRGGGEGLPEGVATALSMLLRVVGAQPPAQPEGNGADSDRLVQLRAEALRCCWSLAAADEVRRQNQCTASAVTAERGAFVKVGKVLLCCWIASLFVQALSAGSCG